MNEGQKEGAVPTSAVGASAPAAGAATGVSTVKSSRFISHRHPSWASLGCEVEIVEVRAFDILCGGFSLSSPRADTAATPLQLWFIHCFISQSLLPSHPSPPPISLPRFPLVVTLLCLCG